jgi:hypothetical protein
MVAELARRAREARAQAASAAAAVAVAAVAAEPEPELEVQPMAPPPPLPVATVEPQGDTGEMYATTALRIPTAAELDAFAEKMAADQAAGAASLGAAQRRW